MEVKDHWRVEQARIKIHGPEDFEGMRRAGRLAAETLDFITPHVGEGVTTGALDRLCHDFITSHGAIPAPLNYRGFPKSICTSVNHVVCHGIPGEKRLQRGDIVNIDVTVIADGWHGDTSRMFFIGEVGRKARRLVDLTYEVMMRGVRVVRSGARVGDIGHAIQSYAEEHRFSVVRDFCGHGLGRVFHDAPSILHYGSPGTGPVLEAGMFFTVEPMINAGRYHVKVLADGWTAVTKDRSLSAQFEHSVGVTADGCEIFTTSPAGLDRPPYPPSAVPPSIPPSGSATLRSATLRSPASPKATPEAAATLRSTLRSATARPPQRLCYGGRKDGSTAKEGATGDGRVVGVRVRNAMQSWLP
ncbi:MAG: type I methionyl aminopeptidase [Proteobacteria bacterium]|nr:type I methionyl aminopeptidase [Pseudomonadota bacterium]